MIFLGIFGKDYILFTFFIIISTYFIVITDLGNIFFSFLSKFKFFLTHALTFYTSLLTNHIFVVLMLFNKIYDYLMVYDFIKLIFTATIFCFFVQIK